MTKKCWRAIQILTLISVSEDKKFSMMLSTDISDKLYQSFFIFKNIVFFFACRIIKKSVFCHDNSPISRILGYASL